MAKTLFLRSRCQIQFIKDSKGRINIAGEDQLYSFEIEKQVDKVCRHIRITMDSDGVGVLGQYEIDDPPDKTINILRITSYDDLSGTQKDELKQLTKPIHVALRQFVLLIKQELPNFEIKDDCIANCKDEWSFDEVEWRRVPFKPYGFISHLAIGQLNRTTATHIQDLLSRNEEALIAISYLHTAQAEHDCKYKWINATIAAELAIKEIIIRIDPKLESLLKEMPSPPLHKLYSSVLFDITGVGVDKHSKKDLEEGAEKRNALVHRPESVAIKPQEAHKYVEFIDELITWLIELSRRTAQ